LQPKIRSNKKDKLIQKIDEHPLIDIFITILLGYPSKIYLIKNILRKNSMEKKILVKEKEYNIRYICLVKNLTRKIQWDKTMVKEKKVQNIFISPSQLNNNL